MALADARREAFNLLPGDLPSTELYSVCRLESTVNHHGFER